MLIMHSDNQEDFGEKLSATKDFLIIVNTGSVVLNTCFLEHKIRRLDMPKGTYYGKYICTYYDIEPTEIELCVAKSLLHEYEKIIV